MGESAGMDKRLPVELPRQSLWNLGRRSRTESFGDRVSDYRDRIAFPTHTPKMGYEEMGWEFVDGMILKRLQVIGSWCPVLLLLESIGSSRVVRVSTGKDCEMDVPCVNEMRNRPVLTKGDAMEDRPLVNSVAIG